MVSLLNLNPSKKNQILPIRLELHLSAIFYFLNPKSSDNILKSIKNVRENEKEIRIESNSLQSFVLYSPNLSYRYPIKKLSVKNIVRLINYILMEQKIIFISTKYQMTALIIEFLLELISPLNKTVYTNISYIKSEMIDYLDTPLPYMIGISTILWNKIILSTKWSEISDDTVAFDIDQEMFM